MTREELIEQIAGIIDCFDGADAIIRINDKSEPAEQILSLCAPYFMEKAVGAVDSVEPPIGTENIWKDEANEAIRQEFKK